MAPTPAPAGYTYTYTGPGYTYRYTYSDYDYTYNPYDDPTSIFNSVGQAIATWAIILGSLLPSCPVLSRPVPSSVIGLLTPLRRSFPSCLLGVAIGLHVLGAIIAAIVFVVRQRKRKVCPSSSPISIR